MVDDSLAPDNREAPRRPCVQAEKTKMQGLSRGLYRRLRGWPTRTVASQLVSHGPVLRKGPLSKLVMDRIFRPNPVQTYSQIELVYLGAERTRPSGRSVAASCKYKVLGSKMDALWESPGYSDLLHFSHGPKVRRGKATEASGLLVSVVSLTISTPRSTL